MAATQANLTDLRQMVTFLQTLASQHASPWDAMSEHIGMVQKFNENLVKHLATIAVIAKQDVIATR